MSNIHCELSDLSDRNLANMFFQVEDGYYEHYVRGIVIFEDDLEAELARRKTAPKIATQEERTAYLKAQHTKQLLNQRNRYFNGYGIRDMVDNVIYVIPREEFYAELNTREHVPNKKEAKAARQAATKRGR